VQFWGFIYILQLREEIVALYEIIASFCNFQGISTGSSPVAMLHTDPKGDYLSVVSCDASIILWNIKMQKKMWNSSLVSLSSTVFLSSSPLIVTQSPLHITRLEISSTGQVIVMLRADGGGQAFTFHQEMG
jgi:hypothetical protein